MSPTHPIYLDYNATTPMDPQVLETMLPYFQTKFGNASSHTHLYGLEAAEAVEMARWQVAHLIGAKPQEIFFTSGATEAINLGIKGLFSTSDWKNRHIITTQTEHSAVINTCKYLTELGASVTFLPVLPSGLIDLDVLKASIKPETALIAIMHGNNETGVIQPIQEIGAIAHAHNILFLTDATQSVGKVHVNVREQHIDLLTLSGHKIYGPLGVGALYLRKGLQLHPQVHGGGQEFSIRSGTLNVTGIVGLGKASEICKKSLNTEHERIQDLRNYFESQLLAQICIKINGFEANRLPHTSNITFEAIDGEQFLMEMSRHLAFSRSSACSSMEFKPSFVLQAMGLSDEAIYNSFRFSLGRFTSKKEIDQAIDVLVSAVKKYNRERNYIHH